MRELRNGFTIRRRTTERKHWKPTRCSLLKEEQELPTWFSMNIKSGVIYACDNLAHAFATSCKHSKLDGYGTWVPCHKNKYGFFMPDIINDYGKPQGLKSNG